MAEPQQYPDCDPQILLRIIAREHPYFAARPYKVLVRSEFIDYDWRGRWGVKQEVREWLASRFGGDEGRTRKWALFNQAYAFDDAEDASLFRMLFGE